MTRNKQRVVLDQSRVVQGFFQKQVPTLNKDEKRASLGAIVTVNSLWILDALSCSPADVGVLAFHRRRVGLVLG